MIQIGVVDIRIGDRILEMYRIVDDSKITINRFGHQVCDLYPDKEFNEFEVSLRNYPKEASELHKKWFDSDVSSSKYQPFVGSNLSHFNRLIDSSILDYGSEYHIRDYVGEIHYVPIHGETEHVIEPLVIFFLAERLGYRVVTYGTKNSFPFLSLISHKTILVENYDLDLSGTEGKGSACSDFPWQDFPYTRVECEFQLNTLGLNWEYTVPHMNNIWFWYDGHLAGVSAYPFNHLIREAQYYPTTEDLVNFYKERPVSIFQSCWDDCTEIMNQSHLFEKNKTYWLEHKQSHIDSKICWNPELEDKQIEIFGPENVMMNTASNRGKQFQDWILNNQEVCSSFLSFQIYLSIMEGVRFSCHFGSGRFLSQIPQINMVSFFGHEVSNRWIIPFKGEMNLQLFDMSCYFEEGIFDGTVDDVIVRYERWSEENLNE